MTISSSAALLDKTVGVPVTQEMKQQLEVLRRKEGERSVGAIVRTLIEEGFERRSQSF